MAKDDWYFVISIVFAVLAFFGVDWNFLRGKAAMPTSEWRQILLLVAILGSLAFSCFGWWRLRHLTDPVSVSDLPTSIRLQFNAAETMPTLVTQHNVWRWYALRNTVKGFDPDTKQIKDIAISWSVYLTFDKPVEFKQTKIDGVGAKLPTYEVKDSSYRSMVVVFGGDLTGIAVDIQGLD